MTEALWRKGALELADLIAKGEVSSVEVVQAHLERIDDVNPKLNAVVRRLDETALAAAAEADRRRSSGEPLGTFHGVPFTVKENIDVAGTPTTSGIPALADAVSPVDSPSVERMRLLGAIPFARTNLPDLGLRVTTESSLHGTTHNPWNSTLTAGGSSGGEGAALASGMTPLGFGNDLGGSLRNPAHCCGITSIKPSTGVVPAASAIPPEDSPLMFQFMGVEGVMARRVEDVRAALLAVAGPDVRDPLALPVTLVDVADRPLRVAVLTDPPGGHTDPGIAAAIQRAADVLANAGAQVVEACPVSYERSLEVWGQLLISDLRAQMPLLRLVLGEPGLRFLGYADERYPAQSLDEFAAMFIERISIEKQWHRFFFDHDVLLTPTWAQPAFALGADVASFEGALATLETMRPVLPANLLGLPAAVVPVGLADGLPVGAQIVGRRFADLTCLAVAQQLEDEFGLLTPIDPR